MCFWCVFFFVKQKTAYEMRISDWSSDVCSSDLHSQGVLVASGPHARRNGGELSAARCQYSSRIRKLPAGLPPGWGAHASFKKWTSRFSKTTSIDRKSVVKGQSVSVRVDLGGRRISKKKTNK